MPLYHCEACNFSSKLFGNYKRHLKTFKHLTNVQNSLIGSVMSTNEHKMSTNEHKMSTNEHKNHTVLCGKSLGYPLDSCYTKKFMCEICGVGFSSLPNKRRHENYYCKGVNTTLNRIRNEFSREKKELKKQINILLSKVGNTTINNNTQTNNIQINNYGCEDMSHITDTYKNNLINKPYAMIPKMIEAVHFNDKKPENMNIILTNKKENKIKVFSGSKWVYKDKDETINNLINGKYFILDEHYETVYDKLKDLGKLDGFKKENYEKFRDRFDEKDKTVLAMIKKTCELILLNNR
jgi:hypothetical protein